MKLALTLLLGLALSVSGADKKKKQKPPDLEVVETSVHRTAETVVLSGRVRNSGEKPIRGLILLFDFMAPGRQVVTTQKAPIDEEMLDPGKESTFRFETNDPPRSVEIQLNAQDASGRDLRVEKPGPYPIE